MNNKFNEQRYALPMPVDGVDKVRFEFILNNIPDKGLDLLDIGCWDGSYAIRYKKSTNRIYGIESSYTSAKRAAKKGVITEQGDFMNKNFFKNKKFDIIIAGEIIEHVFDTDLFIEKINKMLKKDGKLIITTPNLASLPRRILLLFGINPIVEHRVIEGVTAGHIRYFIFKEMHKLLEDHNFKIISSKSDILNFNNSGTLYSSIIPKFYKKFGRSIMIVATKN